MLDERPAGLFSPTVMSLTFAGCLVFICLWLPLCRGCGGGADVIPISKVQIVPIETEKVIGSSLILASYSNGLLVAISVSIAALWRSEKIWNRFFLSQLVITLGASAAMIVGAMAYSDSTRDFLETILGSTPAWLGVAAWTGAAIRRHDYPAAWARLQHTWTIITFFFMHLLMIFQGQARYGYWLTLVGLVCQVIAVEVARHRMKHDLWDASSNVVRPQFSIRSILFWTAFFPIVLTYYQTITPFCDWLFKPLP
jgi:hypothetical protein